MASHVYDFGPFFLDPSERRLLRDGKPVALTPKCFDLLVILVENSGHLLGKDELLERLWPGQFVEEANLSFNISSLRKALGEGHSGRHFIETVPKKGFRFVAHVGERPHEPPEIPTQLSEETIKPVKLPISSRFPLSLKIAAGFITASLLVYFGYGFWARRVAAPVHKNTRTIAVLPFKPLSDESRDESLEMGMTNQLITKLSNLKELVVRPMSSVRKYTDVNQDPVKAGQEVQAETVLDGSIQKASDRVRVTVRLIDVRSGATMFSESFDEQFTDILKLQDSISERVTQALSLKLTGEEVASLSKHDTDNPEAYQLALQGDYLLEKQTGDRSDNWRKGLDYYQQALEKDPKFARPYIGIAEFYISAGDSKPLLERVAKAKAAVLRALELDNSLAEAHNALAELKYQYEFDWTGAETEFKRAIELSPNVSYFHLAYVWYLMCQARFDEAQLELDKAQESAPGSIRANKAQGILFLFRRQYDKAFSHYEKMREVEPAAIHRNQWTMSVAYERMGLHKEAVEEFLEDGRIRAFLEREEIERLKKAFKESGWRGFERMRVDLLRQKSKKEYVPPTLMAGIYALAGEKDAAFVWLDKAIDERDGWIALIKIQPAYDNLRADPRFTKVLERMNLSP
jgi:DNA-binding winged helix-turn-helix (wHTH) protein/TolB-like protein/Flp pilus assembly protein TadD